MLKQEQKILIKKISDLKADQPRIQCQKWNIVHELVEDALEDAQEELTNILDELDQLVKNP